MIEPVTWGCNPDWCWQPIAGVPEGGMVVRRRFRVKQVGVAFVMISNQLRKYYLFRTAHGLKLGPLVGINVKGNIHVA